MIRLNQRQKDILAYISRQKNVTPRQILIEWPDIYHSRPTLNRDLELLVQQELIVGLGKGRSISYSIVGIPLFLDIDTEAYFSQTSEERTKMATVVYDETFFVELGKQELFPKSELDDFEKRKQHFQNNLQKFSPTLIHREYERIMIELSWKSSHIEGNTYTLLDTERLLKEQQETTGHTHDEAVMLLNHKTAFDFCRHHTKRFLHIYRALTEHLHSLLVQDLGVKHGVRNHAVGITGTNYRPLDIDFKIREELEILAETINACGDASAKALIALCGIAYLQPFEDGNKRTSRLLANGILMAHNYCPLSFRSIDEVEYKKAVILMYEQKSIALLRKLFIEQYHFAGDTYFV